MRLCYHKLTGCVTGSISYHICSAELSVNAKAHERIVDINL